MFVALLPAFCFLPLIAAETVRGDSASADEAVPPGERYEADKIYTGKRISLDCQDQPIDELLGFIAGVSGKTIMVPDRMREDMRSTVTLKLKDVPWDQTLDIILASRNLSYDESGGILTVAEAWRGGCVGRLPRPRVVVNLEPLSKKKIFTRT